MISKIKISILIARIYLFDKDFLYFLQIRCTANIHDVYWKSAEKTIEEDRYKINSVNSLADDYFDSGEQENMVDRSDTYLTHIKGR